MKFDKLKEEQQEDIKRLKNQMEVLSRDKQDYERGSQEYLEKASKNIKHYSDLIKEKEELLDYLKKLEEKNVG